LIFDHSKIVLLAGLPRTGSTLLSNILAQNKEFSVEGNSALCEIMWQAKMAFENQASEQIAASSRGDKIKSDVMSGIPSSYYKDNSGKVIVDKCRLWVNNENISMARNYINKDIKSIVMIRPIHEIVASFAKVSLKNDDENNFYEYLLSPNNHVLMHSFYATCYALENLKNTCLFISYAQVVENTGNTIKDIYNFLDLDLFSHNEKSIEQTVFENDAAAGLDDLHTIRSKILREPNEITLPNWVRSKCDMLTSRIASFDACPEMHYNDV